MIIPQHLPRFDDSKASKYGTITYLFGAKESLNELHGQAALVEIDKRLDALRYNPAHDMLALTGRVAIVAMTLLCASEYAMSIRTLMFDARNGGTYKESVLTP